MTSKQVGALIELVIGIALVYFFAGSAFSTVASNILHTGSSSSGENIAVLAAGQTATAEGISLTLVKIEDPCVSCDPYSSASAGHRLVAFDILAVNVSKSSQGFSASDLTLMDSDQFEQEPDSPSEAPRPSLYDAPTSLSGGGKFEGWVAFEVRTGAGLAELTFDPNPFTKTDIHFKASAAASPIPAGAAPPSVSTALTTAPVPTPRPPVVATIGSLPTPTATATLIPPTPTSGEYVLGDQLVIASIGVNAPVTGFSIGANAELPTPAGNSNAVWYDFSALGSGYGGSVTAGNLVIGGRVNCAGCISQAGAVFSNLHSIRVGDAIQYYHAGKVYTYVATFIDYFTPDANWAGLVSSSAADMTLIGWSADRVAASEVVYARRA